MFALFLLAVALSPRRTYMLKAFRRQEAAEPEVASAPAAAASPEESGTVE
jgi:hypothetical protein